MISVKQITNTISNKKILYFFCLSIVLLPSSCKKLIEIDGPSTSINSANVYATDATAAAVLTGVYTTISQTNVFSNGLLSLSLFAGLNADELTLFATSNQSYSPYYQNGLNKINTGSNDYWRTIYPFIYTINVAVEGLTASNSLTPVVKQQLLGEAKFMRAFCFFYLVNLYGDIPLVITTNWQENAVISRAPKDKIYQQIITDLKEAQVLLSDKYLKADVLTAYVAGSEERVRPTKWAAAALLSRVYLYSGDYINAELSASTVINNTTLYGLTSLNGVFKKNSREAIWQLQPVLAGGTNTNTGDGRLFILPSGGPNTSTNPVYLSSSVVTAFEINDQRKTNWVATLTIGPNIYNYPYKYKIGIANVPVDEYSMVMRLGELYLIRAEARAQLNRFNEAQNDLNTIRSRAGLGPTIANDKVSLLNAILNERQVELFSEWGHRWFDLKRTSKIDEVMSIATPIKANGMPWAAYQSLYPIPQVEIDRDPFLTQNLGY
nr:RagB/SusD family nutrient uptake outer membrane protein [uncultured Pedobacter sp.]